MSNAGLQPSVEEYTMEEEPMEVELGIPFAITPELQDKPECTGAYEVCFFRSVPFNAEGLGPGSIEVTCRPWKLLKLMSERESVDTVRTPLGPVDVACELYNDGLRFQPEKMPLELELHFHNLCLEQLDGVYCELWIGEKIFLGNTDFDPDTLEPDEGGSYSFHVNTWYSQDEGTPVSILLPHKEKVFKQIQILVDYIPPMD